MPLVYPPQPDNLFSTVTLPLDNELANAASLSFAPQIFDSVYFVLKRLQHPVQPGAGLRARADGTTLAGAPDTQRIKIKPLCGVVIDTAVRFLTLNAEAEFWDAHLEFGPPFLLQTHYHVYLYYNNGQAGIEISTTPPDDFLLFKQGVTTHRFLFSFLTDGAGPPCNIIKFTQSRGEHTRWQERGIALGSPIVAQDIDLAAINAVPPYVRTILVRSLVNDTAGVPGNVLIGPKGADIAGGTEGWTVRCGPNQTNSEMLILPTSDLQVIQHKVNAATTVHELMLRGYIQ